MRQDDPKNLLRDDEVQIPLHDVLPPAYPGTATVDLERFRRSWHRRISTLAASRCRIMLREYHKRGGDRADDEDYQP